MDMHNHDSSAFWNLVTIRARYLDTWVVLRCVVVVVVVVVGFV